MATIKGRSEVNFSMTIRFSDQSYLKRDRYFGDQKSFCVILDEFIMWSIVKPVARASNRQSISSLAVEVLRYAVTLVAKYSEDFMKNVLDVKYCI